MELSGIKKAGFYPIDGETYGQPFPEGVGGCAGFRIPGLIKLSDGALFATTDARYDCPGEDCGGIDTMFALSTDGGERWTAGYAAYFPDSLGTPGDLRDATICIDPMPVETPDGTLHIFVNLGPTGVTTALKWPGAGSGFINVEGVRRLAVTDDLAHADSSPESFPYYIGDPSDGFSPVIDRANGENTGFAVDGFFNLYRVSADGFEALTQPQTDTGSRIVQNLFYRDSELHVYNTMYTLQVSSEDRGKTWNWRLVSIKLQDETGVISSPGNGLVTSDGVVVLPFYAMDPDISVLRSFLVFSEDNGNSFFRSSYVPSVAEIPNSSESKPVELPDGTLRLFFRSSTRRICYADYDRTENLWSEPKALPVLVHSDCNFGALARGDRIFIAYARGVGACARSRSHGRIYVFRTDEHKKMLLYDVFPVTDDAFSYAVLADVDPSTLAVLYDTCADGKVIFKKIAADSSE
ncbi:MAG: glycoside hydrolase [Clostridia bacterium]|nr:glycoside hydrolase [Clostridia bacterium]